MPARIELKMKYIAALLAMVLPVCVADANVFAAHLQSSPTSTGYEFTYRLNEPATSVTISIQGPLPSSVVVREVSGGVFKGLNTAEWDLLDSMAQPVAAGTYNWSVTAVDSVGHVAKFDQISSDSETTSKYYYGTGVCTNTDPSSEHFGCVYVAVGESGTTDGRAISEGLFVLNNDLSPFDSQGNIGHRGLVSWSSSWFSPMRVRLDGEGRPIISDWSEDHSGVWIATPDCNTPFVALLTEENRNSYGLCLNHGSIMAVWAEGSGTGRVIYTIDEDYTVGGETAGSVLRYDIGDATQYADAPTVHYNDTANGNLVISTRSQHVRDGSGWWITQSLAEQSASTPWLFRWNGSTVDYNSASAGLSINRSYGALDIDLARRRLVLGGLGTVSLLNIASAPSSVLVVGEIDAGGDHVQDVSFDAAGNFLQINSSVRRLRAYSPNDGANSFVTPCRTSQQLIVGKVGSTGISQEIWNPYR